MSLNLVCKICCRDKTVVYTWSRALLRLVLEKIVAKLGLYYINPGGIFVLRRLRDVFYINALPENNEIVYFGRSVVKPYYSLLVL